MRKNIISNFINIFRTSGNITSRFRNIIGHFTDSKKNITFGLAIIMLGFVNIICVGANTNIVSALEYQGSADMQFTINPTISVSVSGDLTIDSLSPGSSSDSNEIDVTVATNNSTGYYLAATVGSSSNATTNLTHTTVQTNPPVFTSLSTSDSLEALATDNTWGYSYSTDDGSTWSNYSGLPLYTAAGATLIEEYEPTTTSINFKIAALAGNTQPAGEYTNIITFTATTNPSSMSLAEAYAYYGKSQVEVDSNYYYTMQDMTTSICKTSDISSELQVVDTRDNEIYLIAHLKDNNCWLLDNLRFSDETYTMTPENTNIADETTYQFPNASGIWEDSYTNAYINADLKDTVVASWARFGNGSSKIGASYNFCAASAGTYCYASTGSTGNAGYDVCPARWRIPNGGVWGNYRYLYSAYDEEANAFRNALSTPWSGYYGSGNHSNVNSVGFFWSNTRISNSEIYILRVENTGKILPWNANNRAAGFSVRCIAKDS